jgi:hypothetical protein
LHRPHHCWWQTPVSAEEVAVRMKHLVRHHGCSSCITRGAQGAGESLRSGAVEGAAGATNTHCGSGYESMHDAGWVIKVMDGGCAHVSMWHQHGTLCSDWPAVLPTLTVRSKQARTCSLHPRYTAHARGPCPSCLMAPLHCCACARVGTSSLLLHRLWHQGVRSVRA